jgi:hypothetical protein
LQKKYDKEQRIKFQQNDMHSCFSASTNNRSVWPPTETVRTSEVQLIRTIHDSNNSQKEERKTEVKKYEKYNMKKFSVSINVYFIYTFRRAGVYDFCCHNYKVLLVGLIIGILTAGIVLGTIIALWLRSAGEIVQYFFSRMSFVYTHHS